MKFILIALTAVLFTATSVHAMGIGDILNKIGDLGVINILAPIVVSVIGFFKFRDRLDKGWQKLLYEAAEAAVTKTYLTYVRECKKASADGKLTDEEKQEARIRAFSVLKEYGKSQGKDLISKYGPDMISSTIEKAVSQASIFVKNRNK